MGSKWLRDVMQSQSVSVADVLSVASGESHIFFFLLLRKLSAYRRRICFSS